MYRRSPSQDAPGESVTAAAHRGAIPMAQGQPVLLRAVDCQREPKVGDKVNFDVEPVKLDTGHRELLMLPWNTMKQWYLLLMEGTIRDPNQNELQRKCCQNHTPSARSWRRPVFLFSPGGWHRSAEGNQCEAWREWLVSGCLGLGDKYPWNSTTDLMELFQDTKLGPLSNFPKDFKCVLLLDSCC